MSEPQKEEKIGIGESVAGAANIDKRGDYVVGRGRPPKQYQWKKGQSGNPGGRPRKRLDTTVLLEKLLNERIPIRVDGDPRKVTAAEALYRTQLAKALKGDTRAAKLIMDEASRAGFGAEQDSNIAALPSSKDASLQSDALFANLDLNRLSDEDKIEAARLAQIIDLGGDFTALTPRDFERAKQIANRGRGKDVTRTGGPSFQELT